MKKNFFLACTAAILCSASSSRADNPLFLDQFSADPTARNFNGKIYLFNSHDILPPPAPAAGFSWPITTSIHPMT